MKDQPDRGTSRQRIVLTGAGGFLGRSVARALVARGVEVVALTRHHHDDAELKRIGVRPVRAALTGGAALARAMEGADTLVHLAYDVRAGARENLAAFDAAIGAAQSAGIGHVVHASSVAVYDDWPSDARIDEDSPIGRRDLTPYRAAKIAMEERLLSGTLAATILQPTIVWGPGSDLWTVRPMRALAGPGLVLPEPCGTAPLLHVEDAATAFALAATGPARGRERLLVTGAEDVPWDRLLDGYARLVGGRLVREDLAALKKALPPAATASPAAGPGLAATVSAILRRMLGRRRLDALIARVSAGRPASGPLRPDRFRLSLYASSPRIDAARARTRLRFAPAVDLGAGLADLAKQFATNP